MPSRREIFADVFAALTASFAARLAAQAPAQPASPSPATSCVLTPVTSEGPYYFDPKLVRADITENQPGVPLSLSLRVVSVDTCKPVSRARVDLWHADAKGIYSGYEDQFGNGAAARSAKGRTYLRGTQITNNDGVVTFRTLYPSWYRGRTPHIHFKVFLEPREVAVSQLYFPDKISDQVYSTSSAYAPRKPGRDTYNDDDMYLRGGRTGGAFCDVVAVGSGANPGYNASVVIGIARGTA